MSCLGPHPGPTGRHGTTGNKGGGAADAEEEEVARRPPSTKEEVAQPTQEEEVTRRQPGTKEEVATVPGAEEEVSVVLYACASANSSAVRLMARWDKQYPDRPHTA